jgi:hypothetical protein
MMFRRAKTTKNRMNSAKRTPPRERRYKKVTEN